VVVNNPLQRMCNIANANEDVFDIFAGLAREIKDLTDSLKVSS
jgi:hypothetical protein